MRLQTLMILFSINIVYGKINIVDKRSTSAHETGSLSEPFKTIQACVNALKTGNKGDECQIREGRYHEVIKISDLHGTKDAPFIISGYKDDRPIIDGTVVIQPSKGYKWVKNGTYYQTKIDQDIWQLFLNDTMMVNARWPNAKFSDRSIFDGKLWAKTESSSKRGYIMNEGNALKDLGVNLTGAIAVMNIGSFNTFVAKVKNHAASKNDFNFLDTFGSYKFKPSISKYFLEDKLELLDVPEEWYYNRQMLYVYPPAGKEPDDFTIRGKVQTYAMSITDVSYLTIKNIDFFATTISAKLGITEIKFDSLHFLYPSYSKRMLGIIDLIQWTNIDGKAGNNRRDPKSWGTFNFFNNTFVGSDGIALAYHGYNVLLENNYFEYNDWSGADMVKKVGGRGTIFSGSSHDHFIRNTLYKNDASTGIQPGLHPNVTLNHVIGTCHGLIQNDGAGIHLMIGQQNKAKVSQNWVHDSPKYGIRFDGEPPRIGKHGTIHKNVVFNAGGIMVKGDYHRALWNTAFAKGGKDDDEQGTGCALCVLYRVRHNIVPINNNSIVIYNLADVASGGKNVDKKGKHFFPLAGKNVTGNIYGTLKNPIKIKEQLVDPFNHDFRPLKNSLAHLNRVGPYLYDDKLTHYWIPGRQLYKTATPVPKNGSTNVMADRRDVLMWLQAYGCQTHHVYFGTVKNRIKYMGMVELGKNVYHLSMKLSPGEMYYWRVDAVTPQGYVYKGDLWSFQTI